jgi:hypothetical protein
MTLKEETNASQLYVEMLPGVAEWGVISVVGSFERQVI